MYQVVKEQGAFRVLKNAEPVLTPAGNQLITRNEALAVRLAADLEAYGEGQDLRQSIMFYHYTMLDFIRRYPRGSIEQQLILSFDPFNDWTLREPMARNHDAARWKELFGEPRQRSQQGRIWIAGLNEFQLCATLVLGKAVESVNVAYLAAGCPGRQELAALDRDVTLFRPELGRLPLRELLDNFRFYWGI